jgi:alkylation response protein AidB-like acyl-CoA dehydrogenase
VSAPSAFSKPSQQKAYRDLPEGEFRHALRAFLDEHYPDEWRNPIERLTGEDALWWKRKLYEHGWRMPGWPAEFGGMGLSLRQQLVYLEEMDAHRVSRVLDIGETMLGPVLFHHGTPEQQAYYLPRILRAEDTWCQGYSEPNAGSDLASLRTAAVRDGDDYVVNGSKIWTTHAMYATHIFCLVRTSREGPKQAGISFILSPIDAAGITVRPIANLADEEEFCEVFFEDVRMPAANLIGAENKGWQVAKSLLGFERVMIGSPALAKQALTGLTELFRVLKLDANPAYRERFIALLADFHDVNVMYDEVVGAHLAGDTQVERFSMLKILATELFQKITEFAIEAGGEYGGVKGDLVIEDAHLNNYKLSIMARAATIYGGSSEVQRNILAKTVLNLPS